MRQTLLDLAQYAKRPALIGYTFGIMIPWAIYSWSLAPDAGQGEWSRSVIDAAAFQMLLACVQVSMVRHFGKDRIALGTPRLMPWLALTVFMVAATFALASAIQILAYLVVKESLGELTWHREAEGGLALAILFPCVVWQVALLAGEHRVNLRRSWRGVWRGRRSVLAIVFALVAGFGMVQAWLSTVAPPEPRSIELVLWSMFALFPGSLAWVFIHLLAFVTFLAVERDVAAESAIFD